MVAKKELIRIARKGNFAAIRSDLCELACQSCGCYDFEGKHEKDCPVGDLLQLIEENVPK